VYDEPGEAHDVVLRDAADDGGIRKVIESLGFFSSASSAAERAVELADDRDAVVWDEIIELRYPDEMEGE
jgi:hypothetical protein